MAVVSLRHGEQRQVSAGLFRRRDSLPKAEEPCAAAGPARAPRWPCWMFPEDKAMSCHPAPDHPQKGQFLLSHWVYLEEVQPKVKVAVPPWLFPSSVPVHTQAALARLLSQLQGLRFVSGWLDVVERFCGRSGSSSQLLAPEPQSIRDCACRTLELCFVFFFPKWH